MEAAKLDSYLTFNFHFTLRGMQIHIPTLRGET